MEYKNMSLEEYDRIFYTKDDWINESGDDGHLDLLYDALNCSINVRIDEIGDGSFLRTPTNMTVDEFLHEYKKSNWKLWRYVCFKDWNNDFSDKIDISEVFCRLCREYKKLDYDENGKEFYWLKTRDLFLYVDMKYDDGIELFKKYNLKKV